ncbi:MAG TPA: xanthine dehydrogenase family protein molybdopterin-binding subunit [Candidatus Dormibacteraeota bacterium]|nr:xanthine dehydrogenase family protein molybdopterin-binding subunit [Candidatus Dormibacteraeota bacterium]
MVLASGLGARVRRREDPRLITGSGTYLDDVRVAGAGHLIFVRSYLAHAALRSIDTAAARAASGVIAVLTAADLEGLPSFPQDGPKGSKLPRRPLLNDQRVCFAGDLIAIVVGETAAAARDAADLLTLELDALPSALDVEEALQDSAVPIHDELGTNLADRSRRIWGDVDAAFSGARHVVRARLHNQRVAGVPIEPRGVVALPNPWERSLTVWSATQIPHGLRDAVAEFLGLPQSGVRVIAPEVGGGFGAKLSIYPEELLVPWVAIKLGRPVRWVEDRSEHMQATTHGRDQLQEAELALNPDGTIRGMKVRITADLGAYPMGTALPRLTRRLVSGCYHVPALQCDTQSVYTTKTPIAAYRGAGRPEAIFLIERLMDLAARQLGIDPVEIRRRNFLPAFEQPITSIAGERYDSGNYRAALDRALAVAGYDRLRAGQREARQAGRLTGIGIASYVEMAGFGPDTDLFESATVRANGDGTVTVITGTSPHGQGHETAWAQLVAGELGVSIEQIRVHHGDTALVPVGLGTFGSRSAAVGGAAVHLAAMEVREKAQRLAAHLLEAAPADIAVADGHWQVRGVPGRGVTFAEIARLAYGKERPRELEAGLESTRYFQPPGLVFPFGAHVAVVDIDRETGSVTLRRYVSVDDCGRVLNPLLVEGQVHGGLAQGIAQALYEEIAYADDGTLLTGNLTTYMVPTAPDLPSFTLDRTITPTSMNPLGVKGIGEAATIGSTPAVVNAVLDALAPLGITEMDPPCTPEKIWRAIQNAPK